MARRPDDAPPSLAMVAAGGVGVLTMVVFVAVVAFGSRPVGPAAGDRLAVTTGTGGSPLTVAVARCPVERVTSVAVAELGGEPRWRIASRKGSIDDRYAVGAGAPTGFGTEVELDESIGEGPVEVVVTIDREGSQIIDRLVVDPSQLDEGAWLHQGVVVSEAAFEGRALAAADCPGGTGDRRVVVWLFVVAAGVVVVTFVGMVGRWWRGRRGGGS